MNRSQLFVINRALDCEDIYGIDSFKEKISNVQLELIKHGLIQMDVLEDFNSFTIKGAKLARQILDYKKATSYIHFNNMIIAPVSNDNAVVMKHQQDLFKFQRINTADFFGQLVKVYPFLSKKHCEEEDLFDKPAYATLKDLFVTYKIKKHNSFILRTYIPKEEKEIIELFFECDNKSYVFEPKKKLLSQVSPQEQKSRLIERMKCNGG